MIPRVLIAIRFQTRKLVGLEISSLRHVVRSHANRSQCQDVVRYRIAGGFTYAWPFLPAVA